MKAIACSGYGPPEVLNVVELPRPDPRDNEVLIRIRASTVTMGDCELRGLTLPWWTRIPMRLYLGYAKPVRWIPGMEFSGIIEAIGRRVTKFKPGNAVIGSAGMSMGGNAEYKCLSEHAAIAIKPSGVSFEEAASIPVGGLNALHFLRKAKVRPGNKVLVIGAGGSIGCFGVQLAKFFGAEVTAIDRTDKIEMLRSIGADHVVDFTKKDFTSSQERYDVIFDLVYTSNFSACIKALNKKGCYLMANPSPSRMFRALWISSATEKTVVFELAGEKAEDLEFLADLVASKKIRSVVDRCFPLEQIVQAHRYVDTGSKKGSVVITIS